MKTHLASIIILAFLILFAQTEFAATQDTCATPSGYTSMQYVNSTVYLKILLVDFPDVAHRTLPSAYVKQDFENMLLSLNTYVSPSTTPDGDVVYGSMNDYYKVMSSGNLTISGRVVNNIGPGNLPIWLRMGTSQTKAYYYTQTLTAFIVDATNLAQSQGLDVSTPNQNTFLAIIYAGNAYYLRPDGVPSALNPRASGNTYIMSERYDTPFNQETVGAKFSRIGVHCHEFAHTLGISHSSGSRADVMESGSRNGPGNRGAAPAPLNPIARMIKGWINPTPISGQQPWDLYYSISAPQVFKINSNATGNYFLIENRHFCDSIVIGSTKIPDYNNTAFMPISWSQNSPNVIFSEGILVWRVTLGAPYDYGDNGLIYASGRYGASWPDNNPSETDAGDLYPGTAGIKVLSPWSDSRDPTVYDYTLHRYPIFVPDTKPGTNVAMEVTAENQSAGYISVILYGSNPEQASPSKPQNLQVTSYLVQTNPKLYSPRLTWNSNAEPNLASYKIYRKLTPGDGNYHYLASVSSTQTYYLDGTVYTGSGGSAGYEITAVNSIPKESIYSDHVTINVQDTWKPYVQPVEDRAIPDQFKMDQNHPNPFNPVTHLKYQLAEDTHVALKLYDVLGREVMSLIDEQEQAGYHEFTIDGSQLSSGVYFAQLVATDGVGQVKLRAVNKLILAK